MLVEILFWSFSAVLVGAALGVILSRNPVHSVLYLVLCFFNAAVLWLLIEAEFLAIVLVLVYVGAVMVLFLFVVMMLDISIGQLRGGFARNAARRADCVHHGRRAGLRSLGAAPRHRTAGRNRPDGGGTTNTAQIGAVLYTSTSILQLAAIVLLIAIVRPSRRRCAGAQGLVQDIGKRNRCAPPIGAFVSMPPERSRDRPRALPAARRRPIRDYRGRIFINRKNVILLLMCIELMLLAVNFNFVAFSRFLGVLDGQVFVFFILTVAAAEAAIGLAILVVLFRQRRTINVEELDAMKG
jgi:NADH:ubiquinone oxidoreductase subunit 6 (subunit J)/NADH:ubiquinone oxidoreductase subunit K